MAAARKASVVNGSSMPEPRGMGIFPSGEYGVPGLVSLELHDVLGYPHRAHIS